MSQIVELAPNLEAAPRGPGRSAAWGLRLRRYLPAALVFILALVLWEWAVGAFNIQNFLLPRPSVIAATFADQARIVVPAGLFTLRESLGGFVLGCALGVLVALATARWTAMSEGLLPFAVLVNSTPIVALAPIMNNWFGITNPLAKMSIVAVLVFFPVMINTVRGLTQVDPAALELMRSYAAKDLTVLRQLRLPNALPYMFSAFKVASTLSIIGAIVSEYFGGSREALGIYISQQAALFHFAQAWAGILVACAMGIAFYGLILICERMMLPWHVSLRAAAD
jgi:NitT/TauT family transport system permease protein